MIEILEAREPELLFSVRGVCGAGELDNEVAPETKPGLEKIRPSGTW